MKKIFLSALVLGSFMMDATAQESMSVEKHERQQSKGQHKDGRHEKMMKDVNLTEAQKSEMQANRQAMKSQMEAIDKDVTLSDAQKSEKKQALKQQVKSQNKQILTPEQQAKMQAAKKARHDQDGDKKKRLADMKDELGLSDEQVMQLKALDVSLHAKMKSIRNDSKMDEAEKKKQMMELKKSTREKQRALLSADQIKKLENKRKSKRKQIS